MSIDWKLTIDATSVQALVDAAQAAVASWSTTPDLEHLARHGEAMAALQTALEPIVGQLVDLK